MKSSITSKNSPPGFVSAPSADRSRPPERRVASRTRIVALPGVFHVKFQKTSAPSAPPATAPACARGCAQPAHTWRANPGSMHNRGHSPNRYTQNPRTVPMSCTARPALPAAQTPCCAQAAQALLLLLRSLTNLFFRKRCWGRTTAQPGREPGKTRLSPLAFSFQDGLRRSTVVVRQPVRWSQRLRAQPSVGGRQLACDWPQPLKSAVLFEVIEGTQWTWRRPPSA